MITRLDLAEAQFIGYYFRSERLKEESHKRELEAFKLKTNYK